MAHPGAWGKAGLSAGCCFAPVAVYAKKNFYLLSAICILYAPHFFGCGGSGFPWR